MAIVYEQTESTLHVFFGSFIKENERIKRSEKMNPLTLE